MLANAAPQAERDRRAIRALILKVAIFLLVPVLAAAILVPLTLR